MKKVLSYDPKTHRCSREQYELISTIVEPILSELHSYIIGHKGAVTRTVMSLFAVGQIGINPVTSRSYMSCGHILFIGPTGTGKTELCKCLAQLTGGKHKRVQGVPDLQASDITGFELLSLRSDETLRFREGPVFANVLLVDEINRIPPKANSGLLQAMGEGIVTYADKTYVLQEPFLCLGTMNPTEQGGTYPLTEALADRIMFAELMSEATVDQQIQIARQTEKIIDKEFPAITNPDAVNEVRKYIFKNVYISDDVLNYCARLIEAVNHPQEAGLFIEERKLLGGAQLFRQTPPLNPRTTMFLRSAAKAQAAFRYRNYVIHQDVIKIVPSVFRTRLHLITPTAKNTLVDEDGDSLYRSEQELVNGLIKQALEGVPIA